MEKLVWKNLQCCCPRKDAEWSKQIKRQRGEVPWALPAFSSAYPGNILFMSSPSPRQQGKVPPSCRWKGTGYLHHAKGEAALPTHWGKLIKLSTVKDLPFCPLYNGSVGKEGSGLSPALGLTRSLAGAVRELMCGCRCDWKHYDHRHKPSQCSAETCSRFFTAKLWDDLLYG